MNIDPYQFVRIAEELGIENDDMDVRHHDEKAILAARVLKFLAILDKAYSLGMRQKQRLHQYLPKEQQEAKLPRAQIPEEQTPESNVRVTYTKE